ncbi:ATP-binding protein [Sporolactobacillus kofuensis]|uniref:histidine kinase n=1 Tax=Sporolactobacillus kofuensis TaxID=269672 RepID=A0ABW1WCX2_9BACL|nr:ATP-binding protein [Sporolactobacillus kofuensis]MCO7175460.1 ATP-binding protein [Sporolactobacillus kofuensis]
MKKRIEALAITVCILALMIGVLFVVFTYNERSTPQAVNGNLDLTKWNFAKEGPVPLNGQWDFYPNKLLSYQQLSADNDPDTLSIPGNAYQKMHALGAFTYVLHIKISDIKSVYGLKTSSIQMANRLIVNGLTVGQSGRPAEHEGYWAKNKPYASYFTLHRGWNTIMIQVANHDLIGSGGINGSVYFGRAGQIAGLYNKALAYDWIIVVSFLIVGIYYISLFMKRKKDHSLIILGLTCIFVSIGKATSGERIFYDLFGSTPFWLYYRLQILSVVWMCITLLLYLQKEFQTFCSKWLIKCCIGAGSLITLAVLGFIGHVLVNFCFSLVTVYLMFIFLYATYVFLLAMFHRRSGSVYLVVAAVSIDTYVLAQRASVYFSFPIYKLSSFDPLIFLLILALLLSLRFANDYQKINDLSERLIKNDQLKDEFLVRTSHEFKSPLHGIMNISKSMMNDSEHPLSTEQKKSLGLITHISRDLSQLVYDILDFSKLKQGILVVKPEPVDVQTTVDVLVRIHEYRAKERGIQLLNLVPEHLPSVYADEVRFGQIISNLLDNAIKHTMNGRVEVDATIQEEHIELVVHDTGDGIDIQELPLIFEPFLSLDSSDEQKGVGLGLSIVKQLVELQNGEIRVSSEKGKGTTFRITLPIAQSDAVRNDYEWANEKEPDYRFPTPLFVNRSGKSTVLIADDNFANLKILIDALQPLDCDVIAVKNGREALEQIEQTRVIDLAILDIRMPELSGYDVCQHIREKYMPAELPVLMVTAAIEPRDKVATLEAGANDFLTKPFDRSELKARISSLLNMKHSFRKALDMEVAFLQSQIKPHFLFNALNSIAALSYTDMGASRKLITHLADYLRGSFQFSNIQKCVPFSQEMHLVRTYVAIEKARFKDRIHIEYAIDEQLDSIKLPPLLIQPLVENAIRHGISKREEGGRVKVSAFVAGEDYVIKVEDNGVGMPRERFDQLEKRTDSERGVGLKNISSRLKYEYGTELNVQSEPEKGTCISFRIPAE